MTNKNFKLEIARALEAKEITIKEIEANEREGKNKLGEALGINLSHCCYLGAKYCKDFNQVKYYHIPERPGKNLETALKQARLVQPNTIGVEFYSD